MGNKDSNEDDVPKKDPPASSSGQPEKAPTHPRLNQKNIVQTLCSFQ